MKDQDLAQPEAKADAKKKIYEDEAADNEPRRAQNKGKKQVRDQALALSSDEEGEKLT